MNTMIANMILIIRIFKNSNFLIKKNRLNILMLMLNYINL